MYVVRPSATLRAGTQIFQPGIRYVVPSVEAFNFPNHLLHSTSGWNSYNRPPKEGCERIVVYRHSAWGDQLMVTALVKLLKDRFPKARVDVYCSRKVLPLWKYAYADHAYPTPLTFDAAMWYDGHLLFSEMLEMDAEPDQGNAYDNMIGFAGFDPASVDPFYKRPQLRVPPVEVSK